MVHWVGSSVFNLMKASEAYGCCVQCEVKKWF